MQLTPDQLIDNRYKVLEHLGQGGMGTVWKAVDIKHDDEVVIKLPLNHLDPEILKRFGREAKMMRKHSLDCPHILNIEDMGTMGEVPWYAMRYLPGGSVRDLAMERDGKGQLQWDPAAFAWLTQIASALDYLHGRNCFHRDVKPENILFSGERTPYLVDFGIVKSVSETTTMMTEQGKAIGTIAYMAPEILEGGEFTPQSDQYALAVTLYESITGDRPFSGTTYFALFKSIQKGHEKLSDRFPKMPGAASQIVDQALSAEPVQRFDSCGEFANHFIAGLSPNAITAQPQTGGKSTAEVATSPVTPRPPRKPTSDPSKQKKPLFNAPEKPNTKTGTKAHKRTWQRWAVDIFASLAVGLYCFVGAGFILPMILPSMPGDPSVVMLLFQIAGAGFAGSLVMLLWKVKAPAQVVWNSGAWWALCVLACSTWSLIAFSIVAFAIKDPESIKIEPFWPGMIAIGVFISSVFAVSKTTNKPAREIAAAFLASLALAGLLFFVYLWSVVSNEFTAILSDRLSLTIGLITFAVAVGSFFRLSKIHINHSFYCLFSGAAGFLVFALFFKVCYSDYALSGETKFGGSIFLLISFILAATVVAPFAISRLLAAQFQIGKIENGGDARFRGVLQTAIVIVSAVGLIVCWANKYSTYGIGSTTSFIVSVGFLIALLFSLLYRPVGGVKVTGTILDSFNLVRLHPKITTAIILSFATLFTAIRFDWSHSLTKVSANLGNSRSMLHLGYRYSDGGAGVEEDEREAFNWYLNASENGNVEAQFQLAEIYLGLHYAFEDISALEDRNKAIYWYRKAGEQGHEIARRRAAKLASELGVEQEEYYEEGSEAKEEDGSGSYDE